MKIAYKCLQDFIALSEPAKKLAEKLTAAGLEVEHIQGPAHLQKNDLILGTIQSLAPCSERPGHQKLQVSIGKGAPLVLTHKSPAPARGQRVVVAKAGPKPCADDENLIQVASKKMGSYFSEGQLCSAYGLGLGADDVRAFCVKSELPDGTPAVQALAQSSACIFDIALTPNRGDAASHYGVARELGALLKRPVHLPAIKRLPSTSYVAAKRKIRIENPQLCPRYSGIQLSGLRVGPSPLWLQQKLQAIGSPVINNVIDITNYVTHAIGQPLHAFDWREVLGGRLSVRAAQGASDLQTLDGKLRRLEKGDLLICDAEKPLAIAGIIGGVASSVVHNTTEIWLESAYFEPTCIAKTARRLGLQTESSFRYARGTDPEQTYVALCWAVALLQEYAQAKPQMAYDLYPSPVQRAEIWCRLPRLRQLAGLTIPRKQVRRICTSLGMEILEEKKDALLFRTPTYRSDLGREIDVFEEVLRVYGYDKIQGPMVLNYAPSRHLSTKSQAISSSTCRFLADNGFFEIMTSSIVSASAAEEDKPAISLLSAQTEAPRQLRSSLLPSGIAVMAYNLRRKQENLHLFELGKAYWMDKEDTYCEEERLGIFLCGKRNQQLWLDTSPVDFHDISAILQRLFAYLGLRDFCMEQSVSPMLEMGLDWYLKGLKVATAGLWKGRELPVSAYVAELYLPAIVSCVSAAQALQYEPVSASPEVHRDLSLVLDKRVSYDQVQKALGTFTSPLLRSMHLLSVYEGNSLPANKKSYALSFALQGSETLNDEQISAHMHALTQHLQKQVGATVRDG